MLLWKKEANRGAGHTGGGSGGNDDAGDGDDDDDDAVAAARDSILHDHENKVKSAIMIE